MDINPTPPDVARSPNPFVGPRPIQTGEKIYGRERETVNLLNLLLAERIMLFHSPSGAGKTSLLQAALIPLLQTRNFAIQPIIRVNALPVSESIESLQGKSTNRYVYSTLASLSKALPEEYRPDDMELTQLSLADYIRQYPLTEVAPGETEPVSEQRSPLFIFDQFEEVLTLDLIDKSVKQDFFDELGKLLSDRDLFAIFAIREDYLAKLDPFLIYLTTRLKTSFRLELLDTESAKQAIQKTARDGNVEFQETAAEQLVDDLRTIKVQQLDGSLIDKPGLYVEPVQLQVVCRRLWDQLPVGATQITEQNLQAAGDVDQSLADYYAEQVASIAKNAKTPERVIRSWFHYKLITESGVRGLVLRGAEASEGLANNAIHLLVNAHLVRAEPRGGSLWYELAHDRLINPIREDNEGWFQEHLSLLQRQAELWEREKRPEHLLLRNQDLNDALKWSKTLTGEESLTKTEADFLQACKESQAQFKEQQRLRRILMLATVGLLLMVVFAVIVSVSQRRAIQLRQVAETAQIEADNNAGTAQAEEARALTAEAAAITAENEARFSEGKAKAESILKTTAEAEANTARQTAEILAATAQAEATAQVPISASRVLAAQALSFLESKPDLSALLGIEAFHVQPTWEALNVLLLRIQRQAELIVRQYGGRLPNQSWDVRHVALSPDGRYLAWGRDDGSVLLREIETGITARQTLHTDRVSTIAFSPYGTAVDEPQYLASAGEDWNIYIWDLAHFWEEGYQPEMLQGDPTMSVSSLAYNPEGTQLAAGVGIWVEIFDLQTGEQIHRMKHTDYIYSLAWSPDGDWLAAGDADGDLIVWDPQTEQLGWTPGSGEFSGEIYSLAWSPDSQLLAASDNSGKVFVYDFRKGELVTPKAYLEDGESEFQEKKHDRRVLGLDFSRDGRLLASGSSDGKVILWDIPSLSVAGEFESNYWINELDFSDDEGITTLLALGGSVDHSGRLDLFEVLLPEYPFVYSREQLPWSGAFAMAVTPEGELKTLPTAELRALVPNGGITAVALEYAGERTLLALGMDDGQVRFIDADLTNMALREAMTDSGSRTFEPGTGLGGTTRSQIGRVETLAITPDGGYLAASYCADIEAGPSRPVCYKNIIQVWNLTTGEALSQLIDEQHDWIRALAFHPNGSYLVSGGYDSTLLVWDFLNGELLNELLKIPDSQNTGGIQSLAFSPDGRLLAVAYTSRHMWLWDSTDSTNMQPVGDPFLVGSSITHLAFATDGVVLYSGDSLNTIGKWVVDPESWIERACKLADRNLSENELRLYLPQKDLNARTCP